jgi:drug/metabolite transporter (DMT)-like permease
MAAPGDGERAPSFTAGVLFVAAAGVLYGTLVILAKLAYATGIQPLPLLVLRYGIAAAVMWAALGLTRPDLLKLAPRERALGIGLGLLYACQSFAYFWGFRTTDPTTTVNASTTGLLFNTFPLWIAVLAFVFLRERLTRQVLLALALGVAGTALTSGLLDGSGFGALRWDREGLILAAAFGYAVYVVAARKTTAKLKSEPVAAHVFLGSAAGFVAAAAVGGALPLGVPLESVGYAAALAVVATLLPILLFLKGLRVVGAGRAGVIGTLEPVVTVLLAFAFLGDRLGVFQWVGGALVVAASLLVHWAGLREDEASRELPRE